MDMKLVLLLGAVLAVAEAGIGSSKRAAPPSGRPFPDGGDVLTTVVSGVTYNRDTKTFSYPAEPEAKKVGVPKGYINFNMLMIAAEMSDRIAQWTPKPKLSVAAERHKLPVSCCW